MVFFNLNPALLHIWVTLMSLEGCQDPIQAPPVPASTALPNGATDPHAHCEKVTGERDTSVCHRESTGPAQHPEVGARPGTSAPCLMSITVDEGLRVGLH